MLERRLAFLKEFFRESRNTGAICSTSRWAAEQLCHPLRGKRSPFKILEVGAGTGAVTARILKHMQAGDTLCICEVNDQLLKQLKLRFKRGQFQPKEQDSISFFEGYIQEMAEGEKFDAIICSLPFLNFDPKTVKEIFEKLRKLSHAETVMTFYEYIGIRAVSTVLPPPKRARRFREIDIFFREKFSSYEKGRRRVWLNVLPIDIHTLQLAA